jgi:hypothetical protein
MAVTYNATVDQIEILKSALRLVGAVSEDETPTDAQLTNASTALNMMLRAWYADGMPIWNITEGSFPLTLNVASYTIGPASTIVAAKPLRILQAFVRDTTSSVDTPMTLVTRQEYLMLGNKTSSGRPIQLHYDPLVTTGTIRIFPAPNAVSVANDTVHIVYQEPYDAMTASGSVLDFPIEWQEPVVWGLAERLAVAYGLPIEERRDIKGTARQMKLDALSNGGEEGSLYFQPDRRSW